MTPERVTLQLDLTAPVAVPAAAAEPPAGRARVRVEDPPRTVQVEGEERSPVALSFTSESLGRLDLRLEIAGGACVPWSWLDVRSIWPTPRLTRLRDALYARTGYEAEVRVAPRREPLDVYA